MHVRSWSFRTIPMITIAAAAAVLAGCSSGQTRVAGETTEPSESAPPAVRTAPVASAVPDGKPLIENAGFASIPGFSTDVTRATVTADEILSGGPAKDGIPAVDNPQFTPIDDALGWLTDAEPVFVVSAAGETHIYPVQILTYHEIVNDVVGGTPVSVTFCPLCNSGLTFLRAFDGQVLDFGTTGRLRLSNLVMYDRQTETWWQQATGEGLIGTYAGYRLELHPMLMMPWDRARDRFPDALVLSRETGFSRPYGTNPYAGYDTSRQPFLYTGPRSPGPFTAMDRVIEVVSGSQSIAVAYPVLEEERIVQANLGGQSVVVFWAPGTVSALDARSIPSGRDVGSANAFSAVVGGRSLTFSADGERFRDEETGSEWDAFGTAVAGDLEGSRLEPVIGVQHFWFSYSAFSRDGRWSPIE